MSKIRISSVLETKYNIPKPVANKIRELAASYPSGIKTINLRKVPSTRIFTVGEGERYFAINPITQKEAGFDAIASHTVGVMGLSNSINSQFSLPAGTWLINIYYYGRHFMDVIEIGRKELQNG